MFGSRSGVMRLRPRMGFGFVGAGRKASYRNGRTGGLNSDFKIEVGNLKPEVFLTRDSGFLTALFQDPLSWTNLPNFRSTNSHSLVLPHHLSSAESCHLPFPFSFLPPPHSSGGYSTSAFLIIPNIEIEQLSSINWPECPTKWALNAHLARLSSRLKKMLNQNKQMYVLSIESFTIH